MGMLRGADLQKLNSLFIQNVKNSKWPMRSGPGIGRQAGIYTCPGAHNATTGRTKRNEDVIKYADKAALLYRMWNGARFVTVRVVEWTTDDVVGKDHEIEMHMKEQLPTAGTEQKTWLKLKSLSRCSYYFKSKKYKVL